jgi:hypothetical protein
MQSEEGQGILRLAAQVASDHLKRSEREAARDLIRDVFPMLPWDLQILYRDYLERYYSGEREEASRLFEAWMDRARELGMI